MTTSSYLKPSNTYYFLTICFARYGLSDVWLSHCLLFTCNCVYSIHSFWTCCFRSVLYTSIGWAKWANNSNANANLHQLWSIITRAKRTTQNSTNSDHCPGAPIQSWPCDVFKQTPMGFTEPCSKRCRRLRMARNTRIGLKSIGHPGPLTNRKKVTCKSVWTCAFLARNLVYKQCVVVNAWQFQPNATLIYLFIDLSGPWKCRPASQCFFSLSSSAVCSLLKGPSYFTQVLDIRLKVWVWSLPCNCTRRGAVAWNASVTRKAEETVRAVVWALAAPLQQRGELHMLFIRSKMSTKSNNFIVAYAIYPFTNVHKVE